MAVVDEVGGDKDPLRDSGRVDIGSKVVEVTLEGCTGGDVGNRIVDDERIVLPDVVGVWRGGSIQIIFGREAEVLLVNRNEPEEPKDLLEASEAIRGHILLVGRP